MVESGERLIEQLEAAIEVTEQANEILGDSCPPERFASVTRLRYWLAYELIDKHAFSDVPSMGR